jgi:hypothetical protein
VAGVVIGSALPVEGAAKALGVVSGGALSEGFRNEDVIESAAHFAEIHVTQFSLTVEIAADGDFIFLELDIPSDRPERLAKRGAMGGTPDQMAVIHV